MIWQHRGCPPAAWPSPWPLDDQAASSSCLTPYDSHEYHLRTLVGTIICDSLRCCNTETSYETKARAVMDRTSLACSVLRLCGCRQAHPVSGRSGSDGVALGA